MYFSKVLGTAFCRTTLMAAFVEVCFSIRKQLIKNKINEEIALAIICLFHVQIEEPASSSIFKKKLEFTPCKAEQPLRDIEFQEKEA